MVIKDFYDKATGTFTYVLSCKNTKKALVIDPVWNYDLESESFSELGFEEVCQYISSESLTPIAVFETHVHADHITASRLFQKKFKTQTLIHENVRKVCDDFQTKFDPSLFGELLVDRKEFKIGELSCKVIHTPGHTPACVSLLVDDAVLFVGDTIFMPDFGSGRCDFPGGSAEALYASVMKKLYVLPTQTKVYVGHDYGPGGREIKNQTTIGELKKSNKHLKEGVLQRNFIEMRQARDQTLNEPKLLAVSMHYNLRGGHKST